MLSLLLATTFGCGVFIAAAHVVNRRFLAPLYDVLANLLAFICATVSSYLLREWIPMVLAATAVACWLLLAGRTYRAYRDGIPATGHRA
ncbi:hypothetical protein [Corynebacterium tapiri]|uniref:Uncharacterized protein n=1 Tax=Corynebacterium tapiri TaxID=1448266 RepID=A0A5C4U6K0_9CORY|nr:hypothetical protein [Corynebacterium tapiri]TNM00522.1 hypothetical protein FHE74_00835 [Corynebacterium tapiri]